MNETQLGGPNAQEPTGRTPDGRCLLNRLSPDRQAAVANYYDQACKIIGADPGKPTNTTNPC